MTLVELAAAYKKFAKSYYVGRDGKPTDWYEFIKKAMQRLGESAYGREPATSFGPLALKAYRHGMVNAGGGRISVNKSTSSSGRSSGRRVRSSFPPRPLNPYASSKD